MTSEQDLKHLDGPLPLSSQTSFSRWESALRPRQWIKNFFVLTPLLFSGQALNGEAQRAAALAFLAFCVTASGVYLMNDVIDRQQDQAHPIKRTRPIAAGSISVSAATSASAILLALGALLATGLNFRVGLIVLTYIALNLLYSVWLKHLVILDVFVVAAFFLLRLLAGAQAVNVQPSIWLLLCGGLLALFLGFAKRRHELLLMGNQSASHRVVLSQYSLGFLDQVSVVLVSVTSLSYIMYTLDSATGQRSASHALSYSTVFVLYGMLRYLFLIQNREGGNPAETLLTDRSLMTTVLLWAGYCALTLYAR